MTTWNSQIILRSDDSFVIDSQANRYALLERGEVGFAISGGVVSGRIGVSPVRTPWDQCPEIFRGVTLMLPLSVEVPSGSGLDDGAMLRWDPDTSRFVADVEPIVLRPSETGAVTYTATGDSWSIDTSATVPSMIDGGTFNDDYVAPSFTSTITIGAPAA